MKRFALCVFASILVFACTDTNAPVEPPFDVSPEFGKPIPTAPYTVEISMSCARGYSLFASGTVRSTTGAGDTGIGNVYCGVPTAINWPSDPAPTRFDVQFQEVSCGSVWGTNLESSWNNGASGFIPGTVKCYEGPGNKGKALATFKIKLGR